jgi:hypothetical protein
VLTTKDLGQVFGFGINQNGNDGVLASANLSDGAVSVETFDQDTGKITKSFPKHPGSGVSYSMDGVFTGDLALITRYVVPKGQIYAKRFYDVMNPVTANKFTGTWTSPIKDIDVQQAGPNQTTGTTALFAIELKKQDDPVLIAANLAADTVSNVIKLDPNLFLLGDGPQMAQDTATNQAMFALSPDGGAVGGSAPLNILVDLKTGKTTQWTGLNNGYYGSGYVNGLALDSNTGIAATTTELNAQVEFYDIATQAATYAQLPCTSDTDQTYSGSGVANDPTNGLFLVTETYNACNGGHGSAIIVYDESGNYVETISGFNFAIGEPAPALNPSKRMGWAFGPQFNNLQQFFY